MNRVVELAGPAGAGKTTLARALRDSRPSETSLVLPVGRPRLAVAVAEAAPHLVGARLLAPGRWWTREELRDLAYLGAWRRPVRAGHGADPLLLLDHGPVFRLARLRAFGPPTARTRIFERWWWQLAQEWGRLLDLVVYLDAPDAVLLRRIDARARVHRVRGAQEDVARDFLTRYRSAYRVTLDAVTAAGGRVVELDTSTAAPDQLGATVREALGGTPSGSPA